MTQKAENSQKDRNLDLDARVARIRAAAKARRADHRRCVILVVAEQTMVDRFGPETDHMAQATCQGQPVEPVRLDDVVGDILRRYSASPETDPERGTDQEIGYGSPDVTIWQDGRLIAVFRRGDGGEPVITRFDQ